MPERDATLDAFISPDAEETDETDDVEEPADATSDEESKGADGEPKRADKEPKGGDNEPADADDEPAEPGNVPVEPDGEPAGTQEADTAEEQESDTGGEEPITALAETTLAWSPEGTGCAACGEQTRRRWRTDAGFVCYGCVDWERAREQ